MTTLVTLLIAAAGILLTMLGLIAKQNDNIEVRRILAWFMFVIITLLLPSFLIMWLTMRVSASILASTVVELSSFTWQVSWWTGGLSMLYPLSWGCWLYPKIRLYIEEKILVSRNLRSENERSASKIKGKT